MSLFQPFDPGEDDSRRRPRPLPQVPVRAVLPSLVTLVALCAGLTSIRMTVEHRYEMAVLLILAAAVLDGIDGRIARFLKSTSRFGAELDSIADFVNFGVAPAMLIYVWGLGELRSLGWIAVLIYVISAALRLARFNVALDAGKPDWHGGFFVGVPAPAGALIVLLPVYLELVAIPHGFLTAPLTLVYTIAIGSADGEPGADMVGQARRPAHCARTGGAALRRRRAGRGLPGELPVGDDERADARLSRLPAAELAFVPEARARRRCEKR